MLQEHGYHDGPDVEAIDALARTESTHGSHIPMTRESRESHFAGKQYLAHTRKDGTNKPITEHPEFEVMVAARHAHSELSTKDPDKYQPLQVQAAFRPSQGPTPFGTPAGATTRAKLPRGTSSTHPNQDTRQREERDHQQASSSSSTWNPQQAEQWQTPSSRSSWTTQNWSSWTPQTWDHKQDGWNQQRWYEGWY